MVTPGEDSTPAVHGGRTPRVGRILMIAGAVLLLVGVLVLAGVAIYVRYTNNFMHNAQKQLGAQWKSKPLPVTMVENVKVAAGAPVAQISIPRIGLRAIVVELANMDDRANLNRGPGHIPGTAYPGMPGNVAIAGHRTTYGAPFGRIDELKPGDKVILQTAEGKFVYTVDSQKIVDPHDLSVIEQSGENRVTLMACHPKFTANSRIIVTGRLTGESASASQVK